MDMTSKNQYLNALLCKRGGYHLKSKKEKSKLLDEYCKTTGHNRKYVISKIRSGSYIENRDKTKGRKTRRKRKSHYDTYVTVSLITCWKIFDYPCGQRLAPLLLSEVNRLRRLNELRCSDEVARKLHTIAPCTIDVKLKREKELLHKKRKYRYANNPLLTQKIPVKLSWEQDTTRVGNLQIDLVEHCGSSTRGEYICTLSATDISTGWFEGAAVMGKSQHGVFTALKSLRTRFPFKWRHIHTDNGTEFINDHLYQYSGVTRFDN